MPIIFQKNIKRSDLKLSPDNYFVIGDNDVRAGFGGQAIALSIMKSNELNKYPFHNIEAYLNFVLDSKDKAGTIWETWDGINNAGRVKKIHETWLQYAEEKNIPLKEIKYKPLYKLYEAVA